MSRWNKQLLGKVVIGWIQGIFEAEVRDLERFEVSELSYT